MLLLSLSRSRLHKYKIDFFFQTNDEIYKNNYFSRTSIYKYETLLVEENTIRYDMVSSFVSRFYSFYQLSLSLPAR